MQPQNPVTVSYRILSQGVMALMAVIVLGICLMVGNLMLGVGFLAAIVLCSWAMDLYPRYDDVDRNPNPFIWWAIFCLSALIVFVFGLFSKVIPDNNMERFLVGLGMIVSIIYYLIRTKYVSPTPTSPAQLTGDPAAQSDETESIGRKGGGGIL